MVVPYIMNVAGSILGFWEWLILEVHAFQPNFSTWQKVKEIGFSVPLFSLPILAPFYYFHLGKCYRIILCCISFPHPVSSGFHYSLLCTKSAMKGSLSERWYPAFKVIQSTYKISQAIVLIQLSALKIYIWVQVDVSLSFVQSCSLGNSTNMNVSQLISGFVTQPCLT